MCVELTTEETELARKLLRKYEQVRLTSAYVRWVAVFGCLVILCLFVAVMWLTLSAASREAHMAFFETTPLSPEMTRVRDYLKGQIVIPYFAFLIWFGMGSVLITGMLVAMLSTVLGLWRGPPEKQEAAVMTKVLRAQLAERTQ